MRHTYGLIAGASALAVAGVLSVQTGLVPGLRGETEPPEPAPSAVATLPAPPPVQPVSAAAPEPPAKTGTEPAVAVLESRIATLEATVADREATLAVLGHTLAARDAGLAEKAEALAARDAEVEALRGQLASLRLELADLRERFAFDIQLAALKSGEPAAAAEPAALAPAPAGDQPLTSICFDTGSASLSPGGQVHAAAAAVMLADMKLGQIRLVGFTDRTGSPARNQALAEERARAVAGFLIAQGVPPQLIETAGVIDGDLPVPTGPGVPEPLNRSVSIVAVPLPTG
jgi:outer membrane protein OmpA-like peptidoglycan-associated protein